MTQWTELLGITVAGLTGIAGIISVLTWQTAKGRAEAAKATAEAAKTQAETKAILARVDEQVSNSHDSNLRVDLDAVGAGVEQLSVKLDEVAGQLACEIAGVRIDLRQIRADLADETRARNQLDTDAHQTHRDMYQRIHALEHDE